MSAVELMKEKFTGADLTNSYCFYFDCLREMERSQILDYISRKFSDAGLKVGFGNRFFRIKRSKRTSSKLGSSMTASSEKPPAKKESVIEIQFDDKAKGSAIFMEIFTAILPVCPAFPGAVNDFEFAPHRPAAVDMHLTGRSQASFGAIP